MGGVLCGLCWGWGEFVSGQGWEFGARWGNGEGGKERWLLGKYKFVIQVTEFHWVRSPPPPSNPIIHTPATAPSYFNPGLNHRSFTPFLPRFSALSPPTISYTTLPFRNHPPIPTPQPIPNAPPLPIQTYTLNHFHLTVAYLTRPPHSPSPPSPKGNGVGG